LHWLHASASADVDDRLYMDLLEAPATGFDLDGKPQASVTDTCFAFKCFDKFDVEPSLYDTSL
jgi:hypothetical protein